MENYYMLKCLALASKGKGYTSPNPLVGCVVVKNNRIISTGYHHKFGSKHAEIDALDKIKGKAKGAVLYVNLEPCSHHGKTPPCTDRIIKERIAKVVIGAKDSFKKIRGIEVLKKAGIKVKTGVLEKECRLLNQFYYKWIIHKLPYITLKAAQSSDLFVAGKKGEFIQITNNKSKTEVHKMRAWYDAILIGKNTVISDNPRLTVRKIKGREPYKIVLDAYGELLKGKYNLLKDKKAIWVVSDKVKVKAAKNVTIIHVACNQKGHLNLRQLLKGLEDNMISSILVEGGPHIWEEFLNRKLVDKIALFTAKKKLKEGFSTLPNKDFNKVEYVKKTSVALGSDSYKEIYLNFY